MGAKHAPADLDAAGVAIAWAELDTTVSRASRLTRTPWARCAQADLCPLG